MTLLSNVLRYTLDIPKSKKELNFIVMTNKDTLKVLLLLFLLFSREICRQKREKQRKAGKILIN